MDATWIWQGPASALGTDVIDYSVEAEDGSLGTVVRLSQTPGFDHLVVDAGVWKFGRSVVVPAGLVTAVDHAARAVKVRCTKDEIKGAPRFERDHDTSDLFYLNRLGTYYESLMAAPSE
ncbi:PRC-barrel domain containing protein [Streptomyces sp. NPDC058330]|uniref:PRC-barrel domain containing protein n=1 Tax=Streptomyces sp. NPDC058330 TaxID=3346449 RepID=UPI0036F09C46